MSTYRLGILASTRATDLQAIIDAIDSGKLVDVEIAVVISNKQDAYALERARQHGLEAIWINPKNYEVREDFDREVAKVLDAQGVDLVLMIGYMRIVSDWFVEHYQSRMVNVHPSLLPAFGGGMDKNVHQAVLDSGVKLTGCTIHFVSQEVDGGEIIWQKAVEVGQEDTVDTLKSKVQLLEQEGFLVVIKMFQAGKIKLAGANVLIDS
ncbi:MAG TPA: phosphoribosylglycinamide formyltransferase [Candidatus Wirthbacteria bacterium]|nr:phosphoribosylglycinamide formyltransferase [Candidatus Wirthbacteria bacterium]